MTSRLTVIVPTRNRPIVLERSLRKIRQCFSTEPILVYDDASDDALAVSRVVDRIYNCRCIRGDSQAGPAAGRQRLLGEANSIWCLALDDDCYPRRDFQISHLLKSEPGEGEPIIIGFRLYRTYDGNLAPPARTPFGPSRAFHGGASLLHRDSVLAIGGYREFLVFGGEDTELATRAWANGKQVWGDSDNVVMHDHVSCGRDLSAESFYYSRNRILASALTLPRWVGIPFGTLQAFRRTLTTGEFRPSLRGIYAGWRDAIKFRAFRKAISFKMWRYLRSLES
jgi:GT2 family glycosyltransferase